MLDLRRGLLRREVEWVSPIGQAVRIRSTRLVSLAQRAIVAMRYSVEPLEDGARVVLTSELVANEPIEIDGEDPRRPPRLEHPLQPEQHASDDLRVSLTHSTRESGLLVAVAMDHELSGPDNTEVMRVEAEEDLGRVTIASDLKPGETLELTKLLAYGWSGHRSMPSLRAQVEAALAEAHHTTWDGLVEEQGHPSRSSGRTPTSRSTATPSSSRRSGSGCSTRSRRRCAASGERYRRRG